MNLSIILAHYLPEPSHECLSSIKRTVETLEAQISDLKVEIIICDDGSRQPAENIPAQTKIELDDGRVCFDYQSESAQAISKSHLGTSPQHLSHWLYLPRTKRISSKARLWNLAASIAQADKLIFFDDDNYLLKPDSLSKFDQLLDQYALLFGQIVDSNGRARPYTSNRVQGSTFGLHRDLLNKIGGFGVWTEAVSSGIDSDLWFKLYHALKADTPQSAAFTTEIQTFDGCSKRWKPFVGSIFRHRIVQKEFYRANHCKNYRSVRHNPSRDKSLWIKNLT
ncbi:MAG: glycosyltransferase family 2 protein [Candidatus Marinimicrobia bacterium]|nr:glycosyltransferase family 2 protein [Candidatus Neomarinimicrobiota bacterium]